MFKAIIWADSLLKFQNIWPSMYSIKPQLVPIKEHWEQVYTTKKPIEVSWFQKHAILSTELIKYSGILKSGAIIDIGGGASIFVENLLNIGFFNISVLDLSSTALALVKSRLGPKAERIKWIEGNVLETLLPEHGYDVWHDRAAFHFLTSQDDRNAYIQTVLHAVKPGGFVIVATFAEDGPTQCSGLPAIRYSPTKLLAQFGPEFSLLIHQSETHLTPSGSEQKFVYCLFIRKKLNDSLQISDAKDNLQDKLC